MNLHRMVQSLKKYCKSNQNDIFIKHMKEQIYSKNLTLQLETPMNRIKFSKKFKKYL
jgi:hypothetical protein